MMYYTSIGMLRGARSSFCALRGAWLKIPNCGMCSNSPDIVVEKLTGDCQGVTVFGLNRPEAKNAIRCEVTAFVRNPAKLPEELASQVTVKVGDVLEASSVDKAVQGQDAVVIVLGTGDNLNASTVMSEGTRNILTAMSAHGVKRVSTCLSAFSFRERTQVPERFLPILDEHERMLQALKASNLEWVAVLPPHITDEPGCGDYLKQHNSSPGRRVSKYDLGHFMVFCLSDDANLYQLCGISDKPQL